MRSSDVVMQLRCEFEDSQSSFLSSDLKSLIATLHFLPSYR